MRKASWMLSARSARPNGRRIHRRAWADTQYVQAIRLFEADARDVLHISFDRDEDVEPTLALLAEEGVYLNPYYPYNGYDDESIDWG